MTSAVTSPFTLTVATLVALDDHVTTRPDSTLPLASRRVTASCTVPPTATLVDAGDTLTVATGATVTVMADVPLFPSLVAVIVAEPAATPVTRPVVFTVATAVLLLLHVTTRPVKALPAASRGVAVSCTVCPVITLADAGATVTDATGAATLTADEPLWPSLVAVIVAEPPATPVTSPLPFTVATAVLLLPHVTTRPDSALPLASRGVAVSCTACPTPTLADAGVTLTDATGTGATLTADEPLCPSLVAVIVAEPAATAVTRPMGFTVAIAVLLLPHVTTRPDSALPLASRGIALS